MENESKETITPEVVPAIRVLVLDDDEDYIALITDILTSPTTRPYEVQGVQTLKAATKALSVAQYHVCLCDFRLGADTGLDLLKFAREAGLKVPIIILTGRGDLATDIEAMKLGAMDYLPKDDLSPRTLERAIRYAIERNRVEQERVRLERQLRHSQKMETIGTLAGGIAHDFNNILTPILGYSGMILEDKTLAAPIREDIEEVIRAANRAKDLVRQILTFSHRVEHEVRLIDVSIIVKEALRLIRASIPTSIDIRSQFDKECGFVLADASQIHQIVMNLCTNAFHAMEGKGTTIEVDLSSIQIDKASTLSYPDLSPGGYVRLSISDDGCGMDKATQERIFEPFFTTKEVGRGTGLGLSVVHGIVTKIGGSVFVYSEPGQGTRFNIYFPVAEGEVKVEQATEKALPRGAEKIMVVDDEVTIVRMTTRMLERLGYTVKGFTNSLGALAAFRAKPEDFDILLTDQTMPHLNGRDLALAIREIKPETGVILMTGFSEMSSAKHEPLSNCERICKPLLVPELSAKIRKVVEKETV